MLTYCDSLSCQTIQRTARPCLKARQAAFPLNSKFIEKEFVSPPSCKPRHSPGTMSLCFETRSLCFETRVRKAGFYSQIHSNVSRWGPSTCWNLLYAVELACIDICTRLLWVVPSSRPLVKPRGIETTNQGPEVFASPGRS